MVVAGMNVARLNFSHGTHEDHAQRVASVRAAAKKYEKPIAVLATCKARRFAPARSTAVSPCVFASGSDSRSQREILSATDGVSTTFKQLPESVHRGTRFCSRDGEIALRVLSIRGKDVICQVENAGELGEHQGINLPGAKLKIPSLTAKDRKDLTFAFKYGVEYIALSFVRTAADIRTAKAAIKHEGKDTPVIAKLEKPEAIDNLEEILSWPTGSWWPVETWEWR